MFGPSNFLAAKPQPQIANALNTAGYPYSISGITRDSTGAALGSVTVKCFRTADDSLVNQTTSDTGGNFTTPASNLLQHYLVGYLAGSPNREGSTDNTLVGA